MRISTPLLYERGVAALQQKQAELLETQQRLATGRRVLTPADDPVAAAQVLQLTQSDEVNAQLRANRDYAAAQISLGEAALAQAIELVQKVREQAVAAGNGSYSPAEHVALADDIDATLEQLLGMANATDGQGEYLFSGYQGATQPFVRNGAGAVTYQGDDGERKVQAGDARQIALNLPGAAVFERIRNGNGTFTWAAGAANGGTGVMGPGSVANPAALTGDDYQITFTVTAGVTTFDVVNTTTAATVLAAQPYNGAASIAFDGIVIELEGAPANGDTFSIAPSTQQSVFATVRNLVTALRAGAGSTPLANALGMGLTELDQALESLLEGRVALGTRLRELDALNASGEEFALQYQSARSRLQDVDYAKAVSDLMREQASLQAAQQSFARITQLSLFDYL